MNTNENAALVAVPPPAPGSGVRVLRDWTAAAKKLHASMPAVRAALNDLKPDQFSRGYFCAVACYIKENCEPSADTDARSLFSQGGDWRRADPEDIETFRRAGLIPQNAQFRDAGEKRPALRTDTHPHSL